MSVWKRTRSAFLYILFAVCIAFWLGATVAFLQFVFGG